MNLFFKKNKLAVAALCVSLVALLGVIVLIYLLFDGRARNLAEEQTRVSGVPAAALQAQTDGNTETLDTDLTPNIVSDNPAVTELVKKVFKHILLPDGNVQIQTVVKPEDLRKLNPVFYQYVREGDQILIYPDRAILYNPTLDKVIDVTHAL